MRRREIIILAGAAFCGSAAWAQQPERPKRIGVLTGLSEDDPSARSIGELRRALEEKGWHEGKNLQVIERFAAGDPEQVQRIIAEFVALQPDVVVAHTALVVAALHEETRTLPIVFVSIPDPVADGFVTSLARPGGNMTGFTNYDFAIGGKWIEFSKRSRPACSGSPSY